MGNVHKVEEICTKYSLYDELKCELDMHYADDLIMCLGDFNRHTGGHIHGGYCIGQRNLEGRMLYIYIIYITFFLIIYNIIYIYIYYNI